MQLEIKSPELEALIVERLEGGSSQTIEEILLRALSAAPAPDQDRADQRASHRQTGRKSLPELFAGSPFRGIDLPIERDPNTGRELQL